MEKLNSEQRANVILWFDQSGRSPRATMRKVKREYGVKLAATTITRLFAQFMENNCFKVEHLRERKDCAHRPVTVSTAETKERVLASLSASPTKSLACRSKELGLAKSSLHRMIVNLKFKPPSSKSKKKKESVLKAKLPVAANVSVNNDVPSAPAAETVCKNVMPLVHNVPATVFAPVENEPAMSMDNASNVPMPVLVPSAVNYGALAVNGASQFSENPTLWFH